ncbi:aldo/keto reductase [Caldivirga maquilingensis]|uniref:Aldo/keto reductase n=1 Tax=Caldivirga maquilingensis (strain ATCC 700844 / DSM 13496 / JCM 10307 / IC-167) TaxID=397948 RepID=A8M9V4_CALMQ|nr:aldo/keto reductase [Caldivirga maquilingensis]ABW02425.1 aldo/keto reductase [Caldivirga maquilingensis IC-167]
MEYRLFGKSGVRVSAIGMGTYYDPLWIAASMIGLKPSRNRKLQALRVGLENGINLIDTAEIYGSEPIVGEAIRGFNRDELFIATKVWPSHLKYDSVIKAAQGSLRRLGVKYIDLYQIHFPNRRVPIEETMRAMEYLVDKGIVRFIGLSNFNLNQVIEAQQALKKYEVTALQLPYSLVDRRIEGDIIPYAKKENIAILCYYPLGHGRLVREFPSDLINLVKSNHGDKTPAQIALNWIISKHENAFPIPRASNPIHVRENLDAVGWRLSEEEIKAIEAWFQGK